MTRKEFVKEKDALTEKIREIEQEILKLREKYFIEVLERNGYHIGQRITNNEGKEYEIYDVDKTAVFPYALGRPIKKDGTPSKKIECIYGLGLKED